MPEHSNITDPYLHEPKGASTATEGQVLTSNGDGSTEFRTPTSTSGLIKQGVYKYSDSATQTTPIPLTLAGVEYELTNDGLGSDTVTEFGLTEVPDAWDSTTNRLDFTGLSLGDTGDLVVEVDVTTASNNTAIDIFLELDPDLAPFRLALVQNINFKTSGTYHLDAVTPFFMKNAGSIAGGGRILISSDTSGATVKVRGLVVRLFHTI